MQIGNDLPTINKIPLAEDYNRLVYVLNNLRKINLGKNMKGYCLGSGIFLDAIIPDNQELGFPYGDKWSFGIDISFSQLDDSTTIKIYNPFIFRSGISISNWWTSTGATQALVDKVYQTCSISLGDWAVKNSTRQVIIAHRYDQQTSTDSIITGKTLAEVSTLPTNDGGGTLDPLRYILSPLYVLSSTKIGDLWSTPEIYIDIIHGKLELPIYG